MERSRDLRRTTVSAVSGLPRRRQRITTLRDSNDHDRQMELQETVRSGDEREFLKRRRIDRSVAQQRSDGGDSCRENSTDSSDEEYYEEEEEMRIHRTNQLSPASSSLPINRRALRTHRSSPVLRAAADEMFGVPVPRRARSSSAKRLHEYCNSGSGGFGEDFRHRRLSPSPVSLIGSGDSTKKKMRSLERLPTPFSNPPKPSAIQDDIEIEVAEALFDLMKQSQSQSRSSQRQEKVDRDIVIPASDEIKMSKADGGKDENNAFSVQNEPSIKVNAQTILDDSMKERKKEGTVEKDKIADEPVQDLVSGDGFVNKVKVGSPKESESPSCVKVNACDIQDLTVTKAHYDAIIAEAKNETKLEIDLMASPLPSSPEREGLVEMRTGHRVITQTVQKKSEMIPNLDVEKHVHENTQQQQLPKEHKNQSQTSSLPFPFVMNSWPGYTPPTHPAMPTNGSSKSSMIMQPPQFKFSKPRPKRCATHQYLAQSIHNHLHLIKKSLSSESTDPPPISQAKSTNPLPVDFQLGQSLSIGSGKDKSSDATTNKSSLQQASHPPSPSSFLHGSGYILPFGHHQAKMMAPNNSSAGRLPFNLPSPNEASPYMASMAMLQNSIPLPPFKRGPPSLAYFNPSLYPSPSFNDSQTANLSSHKQLQPPQPTGSKTCETKFPISQSEKPRFVSHSVKPSNLQSSSSSSQPMNFALSFGSNASAAPVVNFSTMPQTSGMFQMLPDMSWNGNQMIHQNSEGKPYSKSDCSEISNVGPPKFESLARNINFLGGPPFHSSPSSSLSSGFPQHQLIQDQQMYQMHLAGRAQAKPSTPHSIHGSFVSSNGPFYDAPSFQGQTHISFGNGPISAAAYQGHQFVIKSESMSTPMVGSSSRNGIRNASTASVEGEASQGQKSSPACRRNVPSILSACASQLPELKY